MVYFSNHLGCSLDLRGSLCNPLGTSAPRPSNSQRLPLDLCEQVPHSQLLFCFNWTVRSWVHQHRSVLCGIDFYISVWSKHGGWSRSVSSQFVGSSRSVCSRSSCADSANWDWTSKSTESASRILASTQPALCIVLQAQTEPRKNRTENMILIDIMEEE